MRTGTGLFGPIPQVQHIGPALQQKWGYHGKNFTLNLDGTASYVVRRGETLNMVARSALEEIYSGDCQPELEPAVVLDAVRDIKGANPEIEDFDLLTDGEELTIPAALTAAVLEARSARGDQL